MKSLRMLATEMHCALVKQEGEEKDSFQEKCVTKHIIKEKPQDQLANGTGTRHISKPAPALRWNPLVYLGSHASVGPRGGAKTCLAVANAETEEK